jgi:anti-sigma B factor antagonist
VTGSNGRDTYTVSMGGDIDMVSVPTWETVIHAAILATRGDICLQINEVEFCDSNGLYLFLRTRDRLEADGRRLLIRGTPPCVRRLLELTGMRAMFDWS